MAVIKELLEDCLEEYQASSAEEKQALKSGDHRGLISARNRVGNALDELIKLGFDIEVLN